MKRLLFSAVGALLLFAAAGYWFVMETRVGQDLALDRMLSALAPAPPGPREDALRVFMCGTASPLPAPGRAQACVAIYAGGDLYLVDAGAGSAQTMNQHRRAARDLKAILLTHFHSDHIAALYGHNLRSWVAGRPAPLEVIGPPGVEAVTAGFNQAYALDRSYRTRHHGAELLPPALGVMQARAIKPGVVRDAEGLRITAFLVDHSPIAPAYGYRFDYKGRSVVVSGDTVATPTLEAAATGVDLLIQDALSEGLITALAEANAQRNPRMARVLLDVLDYHAHTTDAAAFAERAGVRQLAFYHLVPTPSNALMTRIFMRDMPESALLTTDGMTFELPVGSEAIRIEGG